MPKDHTIIKPTTRQKRYFAIAKRNSAKSTFVRRNKSGNDRVMIGAAIVKGNYVISEGFNKNKTHPFQSMHNARTMCISPNPNIHAEVDALIYSRYSDLSGCEIFVYRAMVDGTIANCRPCKACVNALKDAGVKHVYYTTDKGYHYERI